MTEISFCLDKLHLATLFLAQNFIYHFILFAKNHCLLLFTWQWRLKDDVNTALQQVPANSCLYWYLKNDTSSKFVFFVYW